jgi:hypothetical protein
MMETVHLVKSSGALGINSYVLSVLFGCLLHHWKAGKDGLTVFITVGGLL